uniref:Uncharacterized protein n=1 Tax=Sphaerodactylus townsendi TaxID=933632 RepID=A0ACB8FZX3_9SAUR
MRQSRSHAPIRHLKLCLEKFWRFDHQTEADQDVEQFHCQREHTFEEVTGEVANFLEPEGRNTVQFEKGMFELHCDRLVRSLSKRAITLCNKIVAKMFKDHEI